MIEPGRICIKKAGREKGLYCVVVEKINDSFVIVSGPKTITRVRRRKCNITHLDFLPEKFDIPEKADDSVLENAWKSSDFLKKFDITLKSKITS